jgi:hypothetical protein
MRRGLTYLAYFAGLLVVGFGLGAGAQLLWQASRGTPEVDPGQKFFSAAERGLWEDFVRRPIPRFDDAIEADFPNMLKAATGFASPSGVTVQESRYDHPIQNSIRELRVGFARPDLKLRALLWTHGKPATSAAVVLHGFASTADKVLGFDKPDYMRFLGGHLYNAGSDVLAFDMPSDPVIAAAMNSRLTWHGVTVEGLWTRAVCEAMDRLDMRKRYERVVVYGVREGGRIADLASVLCEPVSLVVVDGAVLDRRRAIWRDAQLQQLKQPIYFDQLVPIEGSSSIADFLFHSRSPKAYVNDPDEIAEIEPALVSAFERRGLAGSRLAFVHKHRARTIPDLDQAIRLVRQGLEGYDGFGLEAARH